MTRMPGGKATGALIIGTVIAFVLASVTGLEDQVSIHGGFMAVRLHGLGLGSLLAPLPWVPVWLTPLSATLIHGGWLHLILNMMMLYFCGRQLEQVLGPWRLLIIYVLGAYGAALAQWLANPEAVYPMIGASGAISGLIGSYAMIYGRREVSAIGPFSPYVVKIAWFAASWTAIQYMIGLSGLSFGTQGSVAVWAHVGGFIAGLLLARPMLRHRFGA